MTEQRPSYGKPAVTPPLYRKSEIPAGLSDRIHAIMVWHYGSDRAISRKELSAKLGASDRQVRGAIEKLRQKGILIASSSTQGGYFIVSTPDEFDEFIGREYRRKIATMSETLRSMERSAHRLFTEQPVLL